MSVHEILQELPKLKAEERYLLLQKLGELEASAEDESPSLLAALDQADGSTSENDSSLEQVRASLSEWVR